MQSDPPYLTSHVRAFGESMLIAAVETIVLRDEHSILSFDSRQEATLVKITTDDGTVGYGQADATPTGVKGFLEAPSSWNWSKSVTEMLLGEDPGDPRRLWLKLMAGTYWSVRLGLGHVALAAVDMALWDIAGKASALPVWQLLGPKRSTPVVPYVTVYHGPGTLNETIARSLDCLDRLRDKGYKAAKLEPLIDTTADEKEIVELVRRGREHVGADFTLLCDVGYRWTDADVAIACVRELAAYDIFFLETPFPPEQVENYRKLVDAVDVPIAGAEVLTSFTEFQTLLDFGGIDIVQPGCNRVGITESDRLARYAASRERRLVPYGFVATLLASYANIHVASANENVPYVEMAPPSLYPGFPLRDDLGTPEPPLRNGEFEVLDSPGLGVEMDEDAIATFRVN